MFLIWKPTTCVVHWQAASFPKDQDFWIWPVDRHRRRRALASLFLRSHGSLRTYECLAYEAEKPLLKRPRKQSKRSGRDHQFTNSEEWVQVRPLSVAFRSYFNMNLLRSGYQWAVSMFWSFKKDLRTDKTSRNAKTKQAWSSDRFDFCGFVTCGKNFFASCAERSTVMTGRDICTSPAAWWWFTSFWQEAGFDGDRVETTWFRLSGSIVEQNRDQFYAFSTAHGVGKQNDGCSFQNVVSDWMIEWVFFNTQKKGMMRDECNSPVIFFPKGCARIPACLRECVSSCKLFEVEKLFHARQGSGRLLWVWMPHPESIEFRRGWRDGRHAQSGGYSIVSELLWITTYKKEPPKACSLFVEEDRLILLIHLTIAAKHGFFSCCPAWAYATFK